mmetsp:Transcript_35711/g.43084  ORF Transcript_35711/g.43084 Transcript_35711/m.43084 type:complete len:304 (+) Transcript_35711:476-1387(+)
MAAALARMQREIKQLETSPPPGVCAWPLDGKLNHLQAQITGPDNTVYAQGVFKLDVRIPDRYPFEPPKVQFLTSIYHPNIDNGGRICLDTLNMPPKGAWRPALNVSTVLASIRLLLAEPNPDDGLMAEVSDEYKHNRAVFDAKARKLTQQHAVVVGSDNASVQDGDLAGATGAATTAVKASKDVPSSVVQDHSETPAVLNDRSNTATASTKFSSEESNSTGLNRGNTSLSLKPRLNSIPGGNTQNAHSAKQTLDPATVTNGDTCHSSFSDKRPRTDNTGAAKSDAQATPVLRPSMMMKRPRQS